jgi:hypothetical protein
MLVRQNRLYLHLLGNQARFLFAKWVLHGMQHDS